MLLYLLVILLFHQNNNIMKSSQIIFLKRWSTMSNTLYHFPNIKKNKFDIKLLYVSSSKYAEDWHSTMHMHPFTELFYVVKGVGNFRFEDKKYTVRDNDLVIVNRNIMHTESSKDSNPLEYIVLGFEGMSLKPDRKDDLKSSNNELNNEILYTIHNYAEFKDEILLYFDNIFQEAKNKDFYHKNVCQNYLEILVSNILRRTKSDLKLSKTDNLNADCAHIKKYIDIHYAENLTLDTLAEFTYMNKYYLSHVFKENFGKSPIDYLIDKRIETAKTLLKTTEYSISKISELVGYSSQSYFSQLFKKRNKITPSNYRKQ